MHGHLSYLRNSLLLLYSFYKNLAISMAQLFFSVISAFSSQVLQRFFAHFSCIPSPMFIRVKYMRLRERHYLLMLGGV